jgi:hypothetical protein
MKVFGLVESKVASPVVVDRVNTLLSAWRTMMFVAIGLTPIIGPHLFVAIGAAAVIIYIPLRFVRSLLNWETGRVAKRC